MSVKAEGLLSSLWQDFYKVRMRRGEQGKRKNEVYYMTGVPGILALHRKIGNCKGGVWKR